MATSKIVGPKEKEKINYKYLVNATPIINKNLSLS